MKMFYGIAINVISMSKEDHLCMHIRNEFMRAFNFLVIIAIIKLAREEEYGNIFGESTKDYNFLVMYSNVITKREQRNH